MVDMSHRVGAVVGGGLLVAVLIALAVSVVTVSSDSKHPLTQVNPALPTTTSASAPTPTVAAGPIPPPAMTTQPSQAISPAQVTAETMTPPAPRHPRLHELFPHLFPDG